MPTQNLRWTGFQILAQTRPTWDILAKIARLAPNYQTPEVLSLLQAAKTRAFADLPWDVMSSYFTPASITALKKTHPSARASIGEVERLEHERLRAALDKRIATDALKRRQLRLHHY
jgi:hypothetical protein